MIETTYRQETRHVGRLSITKSASSLNPMSKGTHLITMSHRLHVFPQQINQSTALPIIHRISREFLQSIHTLSLELSKSFRRIGGLVCFGKESIAEEILVVSNGSGFSKAFSVDVNRFRALFMKRQGIQSSAQGEELHQLGLTDWSSVPLGFSANNEKNQSDTRIRPQAEESIQLTSTSKLHVSLSLPITGHIHQPVTSEMFPLDDV